MKVSFTWALPLLIVIIGLAISLTYSSSRDIQTFYRLFTSIIIIPISVWYAFEELNRSSEDWKNCLGIAYLSFVIGMIIAISAFSFNELFIVSQAWAGFMFFSALAEYSYRKQWIYPKNSSVYSFIGLVVGPSIVATGIVSKNQNKS